MMRAFDLSPLYRATVGFDHMGQLFDTVSRMDEATISYPPYNIDKTDDDHYGITMAVAGFSPDDITITVKQNSLVVAGVGRGDDREVTYLHRGIAGRSFERRFELADHIRVQGASLVNGLLRVDLVREIPEEMKPRTIQISTTAPEALPKAVDGTVAIEARKAA